MTNWDSPDERYRLYSASTSSTYPPNSLTRSSGIFNQLVYVLFGIYCWEILNTMHVEKALFLRIRQFQWPQSMSRPFSFLPWSDPPLEVLYFLCRYTLLLGLIGL